MYEVHPQLKDELPLLAVHGTDDCSVIQTNISNGETERIDPGSLAHQVRVSSLNSPAITHYFVLLASVLFAVGLVQNPDSSCAKLNVHLGPPICI